MKSITVRNDYHEITITGHDGENSNILLGRLAILPILRENPELSVAPLLAMIGQFLPCLLLKEET